MAKKQRFGLLKETFSEFSKDNALVFASSLAFYTALSLAPLLVILISLTGFMGDGARQNLIQQIQSTVGPQAGEAIKTIITNTAKNPAAGKLSLSLGSVMLVLGALGFFIQLQTALNQMWDIKVKPGRAIWLWFRKRLVSLAMVLGIVLIAFASLFVSAAIEIILGHNSALWQWVNIGVSFLVFVLLFAMVFKFLPDVSIRWKDVFIGALITSVLFVLGKFGIGLYLGHSSVGSAYGAAGSVVMLLIWVYYAALILFFGAELTQVYARRHGRRIQPDKYAERAQQVPA